MWMRSYGQGMRGHFACLPIAIQKQKKHMKTTLCQMNFNNDTWTHRDHFVQQKSAKDFPGLNSRKTSQILSRNGYLAEPASKLRTSRPASECHAATNAKAKKRPSRLAPTQRALRTCFSNIFEPHQRDWWHAKTDTMWHVPSASPSWPPDY